MKRITPVFVATALMIAVGTVLVVLELLLARLPLAASGALLWGFAAAVLAWKQQGTISIVNSVRRLVGQLLSAASTTPCQSPPITVHTSMHPPVAITPASPSPGTPSSAASNPVASTSLPTARTPTPHKPDNPNSDSTRKLREIGDWSPPKTASSKANGRIAASVEPDPDAPFRLFAATHGFGAPDVSNVTARSVALVGSNALAERLAAHFTVQRLHPRLSRAELEHARPTTLIVEEDALDSGPWAGALDPHGSSLLSELQMAQSWMSRHAGVNYVLPATNRTHAAAPILYEDAVVLREPLSPTEFGFTILIDALLGHTPLERQQ